MEHARYLKRALVRGSKRVLDRFGFVLMRRGVMEGLAAQNTKAMIHALGKAEGIHLPDNECRTKLLSRLLGTPVPEALHILAKLRSSLSLPGDVCEFGVAQGATSALLANEIAGSGKRLWLYDSFQGLPAPTEEDELIDDIASLGSMSAYTGRMSNPKSDVLLRLAELEPPFGEFEIVEGFFENSPDTRGPEQICFAYVDFDLHRPILDALLFIHDRLSVNGHVVVDDYGYFSTGAKKAVEEFLDRTGAYELIVPNDAYGHFCVLRKAMASSP